MNKPKAEEPPGPAYDSLGFQTTITAGLLTSTSPEDNIVLVGIVSAFKEVEE
jgi:hypothetical protein